jgi:hypothetical protein
VTVAEVLQKVHDTRGDVLVRRLDTGQLARWSVASIRDGLVSFERVNRRGVRETQTLRLSLGQTRP